MADKLVWECLAENYINAPKAMPDGFTYRAKVPGGWLVAVWAGTSEKHAWGGGLTFMPDVEHKWYVEPRPLKSP